MSNIDVGHKIKYLVPEGQEPTEGVVYKMSFSEKFNATSIFVKPYHSLNLTVITTAQPVYGPSFVYNGKVSDDELTEIKAQMAPFAGPPENTKMVNSRGSMQIREDALLEPNKDYSGHCIEGYVKTKKIWRHIQRTTEKMVFFEGGRCSINSISEIRDIK